jgi:polyisoprenoid-binding protein YceI
MSFHGITKNIKLQVEHGGVIKDPWGNTRTGFTVEGKINRKDFGLVWNAATEAGGVVVGEDVKLYASVEFVKQA